MKVSKISIRDYQMLCALLKREYNLKDALDFLINNQKKKDFIMLQQGIMKGDLLQNILCNSNFEREISDYLNYVSFPSALEIAINNKIKKEERIKRIINSCAYSVVLIISSFVLLTIFVRLLIPNMLMSFKIEQKLPLIDAIYLIYYIKNIFIFSLIIICSIIIYFVFRRKINILWLFLHKVNSDQFIKEYSTFQLAQKLILMLENGVSIKDAINILKKDKRLYSVLAYRLNEHFTKGLNIEETIKDDFLDVSFYPLCLYGIKERDLNLGLNNYLIFKEKMIEKRIKKVGIILQIISYGLVGLILIIMYQILLLPLENIGGLV